MINLIKGKHPLFLILLLVTTTAFFITQKPVQSETQEITYSSPAQLSPEAKRERIKELRENLEEKAKYEAEHGQLTTDEQGNKYFTGESAKKMQALRDETRRAIDELIRRPTSEQAVARNNISEFAQSAKLNASDLSYAFTNVTIYNQKVKTEIYVSGLDAYEIDTRTEKVIDYGERLRKQGEAPRQLTKMVNYNKEQLKNMAKVLADSQTDIDLNTLTYSIAGDTDDTTYGHFFFRWEDQTQKLEDVGDMHPFIQVGYNSAGEILSYTNTLGL